jgi:hypothetical protein
MSPRIKYVKPIKDFRLWLEFNSGEVKIFNVKPYLTKGIFRELKNPELFNSIRIVDGSVQWSNDVDFCPDTLYLESASFSLKH